MILGELSEAVTVRVEAIGPKEQHQLVRFMYKYKGIEGA